VKAKEEGKIYLPYKNRQRSDANRARERAGQKIKRITNDGVRKDY
jgi:hypothetical protein